MKAATTKSTGKRGRPVGSRNKIKGDNLPIYTWKCKNTKCKKPTRLETTAPCYSVVCGSCHTPMDCNRTKGIVKE